MSGAASGGASSGASSGTGTGTGTAKPPKLNLGPVAAVKERGRRPSLADNSPRLNSDSVDDSIVQASVSVLHAAKKLVLSSEDLLRKGKELHVALVALRDLILQQVKVRADPRYSATNKRVQRRCNVLFDLATDLLKACKVNAPPAERKTFMSGMADAIGFITQQQYTIKSIRGLARSALVLAKEIKGKEEPDPETADAFAEASGAFASAVTSRAFGISDAGVRDNILDLLDDVFEKSDAFAQAARQDAGAAHAASDVYSSALAALLSSLS